MMDIQELGVRVTYRDRDMRPTHTKTYDLCEYTDMLRNDILRLITDIENMCYIANGDKPREEWDGKILEEFRKIKHKMLDKAGDIGRIPQNIIIRTREPMTEYLARVLDGEGGANGKGSLGSTD